MSHQGQHGTTSGLGPGNISYHDILYIAPKCLPGISRKSKHQWSQESTDAKRRAYV